MPITIMTVLSSRSPFHGGMILGKAKQTNKQTYPIFSQALQMEILITYKLEEWGAIKYEKQ